MACELNPHQIVLCRTLYQLPVVSSVLRPINKSALCDDETVILAEKMEVVHNGTDMSINRRCFTHLCSPFCPPVGGMKNRAICATAPSLVRIDKKYRVKVTNRRGGIRFNEVILFPPRITAVSGNKDSVVVTDCPPAIFIYKENSLNLKVTHILMLPCFSTVFCVEHPILSRNPTDL